MRDVPSAAVAIIRVNEPEDSVLLVRRNNNPQDPWSGHFAFPGGRMDLEDPSLLATCTRETYEETGITLTDSELATELQPRHAGSRVNSPILVQPFLFTLEQRPPLTLETREIANACWLSIERFMEQENHIKAEVLPDRFAPAFPIDDYFLWGFTYGLLANLLDLKIETLPA